MRNILILLLLALCIGIFGCEPDVKGDAPLAEEVTAGLPVEQPPVEIGSGEPDVEPIAAKTGTVIDNGMETEPETAVTETAVDIVKVTDEKPAEEIAPNTDDKTGSKPDAEADGTDGNEPEADKEETAEEKTKTSKDDETAEKPKTPTPPAAKDDTKEKTPKKDDEPSRPKLADTEFFKKCDFVFKNFVDKKGMVNYRKLRRKKRELLAAVKELGNLPTEIRILWSKNDEKAFLLNAHNILMLKVIIDNYPIKPNKWFFMYPANSIKHIPGAREKKFFRVSGLNYTLVEIEDLLLKTAKDPKYCFALSNATMMGGKLRNEAYHPDKLDKQIDEQVKKYLLDPKNLSISTHEKKIYLSSMFKLKAYKTSFLNSRYAKIKRFREMKPDVKAFLNFIFLNIDAKTAKELESAGYEVEPRKYDWLLNEPPLR